MFQDLRVIDFHAHFPVRGDPSTSGPRSYAPGSAAAGEAEYLRARAARQRAAWRLAWDFPEPEAEQDMPPWDVQADRWRAELDRYGIDRVAFATGGNNDLLAQVVARHPGRFLGFAHHDPFRPDAAHEMRRAVQDLGLSGLKILA